MSRRKHRSRPEVTTLEGRALLATGLFVIPRVVPAVVRPPVTPRPTPTPRPKPTPPPKPVSLAGTIKGELTQPDANTIHIGKVTGSLTNSGSLTGSGDITLLNNKLSGGMLVLKTAKGDTLNLKVVSGSATLTGKAPKASVKFIVDSGTGIFASLVGKSTNVTVTVTSATKTALKFTASFKKV